VTAFFHHPDEFRTEIQEVGFAETHVMPIEGIGWLVAANIVDPKWESEHFREAVLRLVRLTETEPSILGVSGHLLGVARKP
jgi:hypothetical protein